MGGKQSATKPVLATLQRNMQRPKVAQRSQKTMVEAGRTSEEYDDVTFLPLLIDWFSNLLTNYWSN